MGGMGHCKKQPIFPVGYLWIIMSLPRSLLFNYLEGIRHVSDDIGIAMKLGFYSKKSRGII